MPYANTKHTTKSPTKRQAKYKTNNAAAATEATTENIAGRADVYQRVTDQIVAAIEAGVDRWKIYLHWNLFSPGDAEIVWVSQTVDSLRLEEWKTYHGGIKATEGHTYYLPRYLENPNYKGTYIWDCDYLLVTVVPRHRYSNRRAIIFSGIHRPGTIGAKLLFQDSVESLIAIEATAQAVEYARYYQAIYEVALTLDRKGEQHPSGIKFLDGRRLDID